jgi:ElaB/YqjD/DUF883 family membrane-anchored ribosome-binding protein
MYQQAFPEGNFAMADTKDYTKDAIDDGVSKAKKAAEVVAGKANETLSHARELAEPALERVHAGYQQVAKHTQEGMQRAVEVVRTNPGMSLSAAFGVGIALGVVIGISLRPSRPQGMASHFHRPTWLS